MHDTGYKSALARRACRYSDARPPRKTDGVLPESEIPPRMRGKVIFCHIPVAGHGITPAYAGKRHRSLLSCATTPDHSRICGEKISLLRMACSPMGSPPHIRGKGNAKVVCQRAHGITPAYAGKRQRTLAVDNEPQGSPPHMRGKDKVEVSDKIGLRITPAYAGKSCSLWSRREPPWDHPRICGEKAN